MDPCLHVSLKIVVTIFLHKCLKNSNEITCLPLQPSESFMPLARLTYPYYSRLPWLSSVCWSLTKKLRLWIAIFWPPSWPIYRPDDRRECSYTTFEKMTSKNIHPLNRIRTHDLCVTAAMLSQLSKTHESSGIFGCPLTFSRRNARLKYMNSMVIDVQQ